jgi:hypothetical protein
MSTSMEGVDSVKLFMVVAVEAVMCAAICNCNWRFIYGIGKWEEPFGTN